MLYAKYWQEKLKDNDEISFPESFVEDVADLTQGFSFAYLKEALYARPLSCVCLHTQPLPLFSVSTLVRITNAADDDERVEFPVVMKSQIMTLHKELGEQQSTTSQEGTSSQGPRGPVQLPLPTDVFPTEILHAPPSAYPYVMPGSLPSTRPGPSRDPNHPRPAWRTSRVQN